MLTHFKVRDVMSNKVHSVNVSDNFSRVQDIMQTYKVRHVPVINAEKQIVGLVSQRDLFRICKPRINESGYIYNPAELDEFVLKHVMTTAPYHAKEDDSLAHMLTIMAQNHYGCVPVVNDAAELSGIVTVTDILKFVVNKLLQ